MLDWAMAHPAFKTQLFRFVDVFPACVDDVDVMRHLDEYFEGVDMPRALDFGLGVAEHVPFGSRMSAAVARRNITRMARQFIAGATPQEAVPTLAHLWRAGEACTVDLLGEKTLTQADASRYATRVAQMLDVLVDGASDWPDDPHLERDPWGVVPRVNISVKPTALSPLFGPLTRDEGLGEARVALRPILDRAREAGATVHLDTEHDEVKDLTFELVRLIGAERAEGSQLADGPQLGCVVQAYRKDSYADLRDLVAWSKNSLATPLQIRLVKGAYWDHETVVAEAAGWPVPVFADKGQTDANYERCSRFLLDNAGAVRPAFASHNLRSIAYAMTYAHEIGLPDTACEVQLLYGMAEPTHLALRRLGRRVRVYAPVGELVPGMAYLVRRLIENTSNESFIRHRYAEGDALAELLTSPGVEDAALPDALPEPVARAATNPAEPERYRPEPLAELRRATPRARLAAAVQHAPEGFGFEVPVLIDGEPVTAGRSIGERTTSVDPGEIATVVCVSDAAGTADVEHAIDVAQRAWPAWRATPWRERAAVLFRAAAIMRKRRAELAALEVFEAGKPIKEADADVCEAIDFCEYYGREALRLGEGKPIGQDPGEANTYRYQPRGIGAVIAPWNFPLAIPTGMVTAALVTGNCVVFKPAGQTPGVAYRLVQILLEAGVPPGVLAFLPGAGEVVGAALVEHPAIAFVAFTGSKAVGLSIIERAAVQQPGLQPGQRHIKRVVAEMGGKNAIVVDSDADLDQAVPAIVTSAFGYAGQKCSAASRVIAVGQVFEELVERLVGAAAIVPIGHPRELRTVVGPVIDGEAHARVLRYRQAAHAEGEVVLERDDVPTGGWYVGPTIVVVDDPQCSVATEEIFGPFLAVTRAGNLDQALAIANDTEYALTAGVFSRSPVHIRRASEELRAGNVYVNRGITGATVGRQPFGGYGLSGVGSKAGGPDYLLAFVEPRVITENTVRQGFVPSDERY